MSVVIKELLEEYKIETNHEERVEIDKLIEEKTNKFCDIGAKELTKEEFLEIVNKAKKRKKVLEPILA